MRTSYERRAVKPTDERMLRLLVERHSLREIARTYGLGLSTVRYWVRKYGIELPDRPTPEWDLGRFAEAVKDNTTIAGVLRDMDEAVAAHNYRTVHRLVAELGLYTGHWKGQAHGTSRPRSSTG